MATYGLKSITVGSNTYEMNTKNGISINGTSWDGSTSGTAIYAPTTAGTSGYFLKSNGSGAPTWASVPAGVTVTLNGSSTTTPSFYAPTAAGTSGQVLISSGSGAPTWGTATAGAQNLLDGSATGSLRSVQSATESSSYTIGQNATTLGYGTKATGQHAVAEGWFTIASGHSAHAEGSGDQDDGYTIAAAFASHAEGLCTRTDGDAAHSEGAYTTAYSDYCHAGGRYTWTKGDASFVHGNGPRKYSGSFTATIDTIKTTYYNAIYGSSGWYATTPTEYSGSDPRYSSAAIGKTSVATGSCTLAAGDYSHAEGCSTIAYGARSHAQNCSTQANGAASSAAGWGTIAGSDNQFVIGKWNTSDTNNTYAFIIGNGSGPSGSGSSITYNRNNIFTVSWTGNTVIQNGLEVASLDHTITSAEYTALMTSLDAV